MWLMMMLIVKRAKRCCASSDCRGGFVAFTSAAVVVRLIRISEIPREERRVEHVFGRSANAVGQQALLRKLF